MPNYSRDVLVGDPIDLVTSPSLELAKPISPSFSSSDTLLVWRS